MAPNDYIVFKRREQGIDTPLYWGEIHIHSALSDGRGTPAQNLRHACDVAGLDFAAITDHAESLNDDRWEIIKQATEKYYDPGKFVTLLGFEWTHPSGNVVWKPLLKEGLPPSKLSIPRYGHRNVYYKGMEGDYYAWNAPRSNTPEKLWKRLREQGNQSLVIPHHPASYIFPVDWKYFNPEFERLVEIYSIWGSSEIPASHGNIRPILRGGGEVREDDGSHVQYALNKGYRVGIIAGSDGHDGYGGRARHHIHNLTEHSGPFYPSGITGVYADDLSREAIWGALWDRRTFGTTGSKIALKFSINGYGMGTEIGKLSDSELHTEIEIHGTADIQKVEFIENGNVIKKFNGVSPVLKLQTKLPFNENLPKYYYLRVTQTDGEIAWSSPIWVG